MLYALSASASVNVVSSMTSTVDVGKPLILTFTSISPGIFPASPSRPSFIPTFTFYFSSVVSSSFSFHNITCLTIYLSLLLYQFLSFKHCMLLIVLILKTTLCIPSCLFLGDTVVLHHPHIQVYNVRFLHNRPLFQAT